MFKKHKLDNFQYALIIIFLLATLLIPILYVANVSSYLTSKFAWFYVIFALLIIGFFAFILIFNLIKFRHAINLKKRTLSFIKGFFLIFILCFLLKHFKGTWNLLSSIEESLFISLIMTFSDLMIFKDHIKDESE